MTTIGITHPQGFKHPGCVSYYSQDQDTSGRTVGRSAKQAEALGLLRLSSFLLEVAL